MVGDLQRASRLEKNENSTVDLDLRPRPKKKKLSYNEKRELAALPGRIDVLEKEIAAIEADLVAGKIYSNERLAPAQAELEAAVERWAELAERAEDML